MGNWPDYGSKVDDARNSRRSEVRRSDNGLEDLRRISIGRSSDFAKKGLKHGMNREKIYGALAKLTVEDRKRALKRT